MTREEAIKTLKYVCVMCCYEAQDVDSCDISSCDVRDAIYTVEEALDRKKGEWVEERLTSTKGGTYSVARCSECGCAIGALSYNSYCPNCGADMRGDTE